MKLIKITTLTGLCLVLGLMTTNWVFAQQGPGGPGGFDPAQMRERILERSTTNLNLTPQESKIIVPMIDKVLESRFAGFEDRRTLRQGLNDLLQDPKSSEKAIKQQLDKIKAKEAELRKASEDAEAKLKSVITVRQEALLTEAGIVNGGGFGGGFGRGPGGRGGNGGGNGGRRGGNGGNQN